MRTIEHNLDSLRRIIRELQQENNTLKALLSEHNIAYEEQNVPEEPPMPDEYDDDQGARILPSNPTVDDAKAFYGYFWGRTDVYANCSGSIFQGFVRKFFPSVKNMPT